MAEEEFYKVGGTVHSGAPSYIVRQADDDLYSALKAGEFSYVLDSRQLGKSSLMVHTAARLRKDGVTVVILDLTAVGQTLNPDQWYAGLLSQVTKELCQAGLDVEDALDEFWLAHRDIGPMQRWVEALRDVILVHWRGHLVVFVDEIDAVRSLQFSAERILCRHPGNLQSPRPGRGVETAYILSARGRRALGPYSGRADHPFQYRAARGAG